MMFSQSDNTQPKARVDKEIEEQIAQEAALVTS